MYKTKKHGIPLSCIVSLVFPILGMVSACNTYKNCIGYEIPYGRMKEAARLDDKQFCIVLTDSNSVEKYKNTIIAGMEDCGRTLWSFINIDNPDNNWYKWLLGVWNSPFTLIFDKNGQLENIVFGISEYARMSIESTVSPHNEDEGIRHKNFGFRANSAIPESIMNVNEFIESHLQLIADTTETYYGKYLKADSLAMISEYPFSEYLKLYYGSHQSPLEIETHIAKGPYRVGDEANITVSVTNYGHENITIEKIETTCGCIKTIPAGRHFRKTIRQNETVNYRFSMELEYSGTIYHEIYFYFHTGNAASLATAGIELNVEQ